MDLATVSYDQLERLRGPIEILEWCQMFKYLAKVQKRERDEFKIVFA